MLIFVSLTFVSSCSSLNESKRSALVVKDEMIVLGFVENVWLGDGDLHFTAKMDTGADTSSIDAEGIDVYEKPSGETWVKFKLIGRGDVQELFDVPVVRMAYIKKKQGGSIARPVVMLTICVGGKSALTEVNLADRSVFKYNMLIGREFLKGRILLDSSQKFKTKKNCG